MNKEKAMKNSIGLFILIGLLSACVTINIYFPAAAAQEVADEIIDDVWQLKKDKEGADVKAETSNETTTEPEAE